MMAGPRNKPSKCHSGSIVARLPRGPRKSGIGPLPCKSRWGHQIVFVDVFDFGFEKHSNVSRSHVSIASLLVENLLRLLLVERHRALQLWRPNRRVDLRRVQARVPEERAHLLEVMMLLQHFERHAVPQIVRLEHRVADQPAVDLAEPPDVLARHRSPGLATTPPTPCRPE